MLPSPEKLAKLTTLALKLGKQCMAATDKYAVRYKGKIAMYLNPSLVASQGITNELLTLIKRLHKERLAMFDEMQEMNPAETRVFLRLYAGLLEQIEFALQAAWKFDEDRSKHTWWYQVPHCTCPKSANAKLFGEPHRIIEKTCPVHGE